MRVGGRRGDRPCSIAEGGSVGQGAYGVTLSPICNKASPVPSISVGGVEPGAVLANAPFSSGALGACFRPSARPSKVTYV